MRFLKTSIFVLLLLVSSAAVWSASGGLTAKEARELLRKLGGADLKPEQVRIKTISGGIGGSDTIVEAQIETAVRFKQTKGQWQVEDIRLGDRNWESVELVLEGVKREKIRRTEAVLQKVATALDAYRKDKGGYFEGAEFAALLDKLSPAYLPVPARFDLWGQELKYEGKTSGYKLYSLGPDRKAGTTDDLVIVK